LYPRRGRCVSLPPYPWQRERYWFDQLDQAAAPAASDTRLSGREHPLLGLHLSSALPPNQHFWEIDLSLETLHYLDDHRVEGRALMPGAAWLEMTRAAADSVIGGPCELADVRFERPLVFDHDAACRVQLVLTVDEERCGRFQIF